MKCDNCGQENSEESKFCNNCGSILSSQPVKAEEPQTIVQTTASPEMVSPQVTAVKKEVHPSSTSMIVFAVINILCCGSFILGVIALVFALMSNSETDIAEAQRKLRIAKTLNIIGIILGVIKVIIAIIFFVMIIIYGNGEFAGYDYSNYF
ncbi:MAG: CD225/dispanin family protein [Saccharofermentanales bacterium]